MKRKIEKAFIRQQYQFDCGIACLSSLVRFFGGEIRHEELIEISGTNEEGTTIFGLYNSAKILGFDAEGFEAEGVDNLKELSDPAILHVTINSHLNHFIIFYPTSTDSFLISDPSKGVYFCKEEDLELIWKSKALLQLKPGLKFEEIGNSKFLWFNWFYKLVKDDIPLLGASIVLGTAISVLGIVTSIFSQKLIDEILPERQVEKLVVGIVLVSLLLLGRGVLAYVRGLLIVRQSKGFNIRMISGFFGNLLRLPKSFFDTRKTGDLVARMNDTRRIQQAVSYLVSEIVVDSLLVVVAMLGVFAYSSQVGTMVALILPFYFLMAYRFHRPIHTGQQSVMKSYALTESHYIDTLQGIGSIKTLNKEDRFDILNQKVYGFFQEQVYNLGIVGSKFGFFSGLVGVLFSISVMAYSSYFVLNSQLQVGEMVAILGFTGMIIPAVGKLAMANIPLQEARIAFDRMYEFASAEQESVIAKSKLPETIHSISLENVSFRFPGRKPILKELNIHLEKGKLIALLGESGGGKSTLLQILMKFYHPENGKIIVNQNQELGDISFSDWRRSVGYVEQETKIFNGSILENICLDEEANSEEKVNDFCDSLGLREFFSKMPQGYRTIVGEEGLNLSGGQKQIIALARAMYHRPKALLLDEFTGAMDRNNENLILDLLQRLKQNMPILLVTHRIKPALISDYVYILESGIISASGLPSELMTEDNLLSRSCKDVLSLVTS
ncbi:peptidase domain-containing ABC transporter [Cognataquiflexum nitidum]|uniref:peptidase domain-containing ABC transporter n=1 Tax=Cognataquiflexum nitidum TaxID=2922272 RepID=UPI001F12BEE6|nr:peptidase domain-containing ABC transporter [Cognataquiflexum nitidum]